MNSATELPARLFALVQLDVHQRTVELRNGAYSVACMKDRNLKG